MAKLRSFLLIGVAALTLLVLGTVLFLTTAPGERLIKGWLERRLTTEVGLPVRMQRFETNLWSRVQIDSLVVVSETGAHGRPMVFVGRIRIGYSIPRLLGKTPTFKKLALDSIAVSLELDSLGRLGIPLLDHAPAASRGSGKMPAFVSVDTISLNQLDLLYRAAEVPLSVELLGAVLSARGTGDGSFSGRLSARHVITVYDSLALNLTDLQMTATIDREAFRLQSARAHLEGLRLEAGGSLGLADSSFLAFTVSADGLLDTLAPRIATSFELPPLSAGHTSAHCRIDGTLDDPQITLDADFDSVVLQGVSVPVVGLRARYVDGQVRVDTFHLSTLSGKIQGHASAVLDTAGPVSLDLLVEGIDLSSLWQILYAEDSPFRGTIGGRVRAQGYGSDLITWSAEAAITGEHLRYLERTVPDLQCTARLEASRADLSLIHGRDAIHAEVSLGADQLQGTFDASVPDLAALARFLDQPALAGSLRAQGTIDGPYSNPAVHATILGSEITYRHFPIDSVRAELSYADGDLALVDFACAGKLDSINPQQPPFDLDSLAGSLAYRCRLQGPWRNLSGDLTANLSRPRYRAFDLDSLSLEATLSGSQLWVTELKADRAGLTALLSATYDTLTASGSFGLQLQPVEAAPHADSEPAPVTIITRATFGSIAGDFTVGSNSELSSTVQGRRLWLGALSMFTSDTMWSDGEMDFDLVMEGPFPTPNAALDATIRSLRVSGYRIDSVTAHLSVDRDALVLDSLASYALGHTLRASGQLELDLSPDGYFEVAEDARVEAQLETRDFDLAALNDWIRPEREIAGAVSTTLRVRGTVASPRVAGWLTVHNGRVRSEDTSWQLDQVRLSVSFADSVLTIDTATGVVSDVTVRARGSMTTADFESAVMDLDVDVGTLGKLRVAGTVSDTSVYLEIASDSLKLAVFQPFLTRFDSLEGRLGCRAVIFGSPAAPQIDGSLAVRDLSVRSLRHHIIVSDGHLDIRFDKNQVMLDSATAALNGGRLVLSGLIAYDQGTLRDVDMTLRATEVTWQQPGVYILAIDSAMLSYGRQQENYVLDGDVVLGEARLTAGLRITSVLPWAKSLETVDIEWPEMVARSRLDVRIRESDALWIDNNLGRVRLRADLGVIGSPVRPNFTGLVRVEEGYLLYLDRRFHVDEGVVYFNDPARFNPDVRLNATTKVTVYRRTAGETYTVHAGAEGRLDQLQYGLYSEPPLDQPDIVALLTLGATRSELAGRGANHSEGGLTDVLKDRAAMLTSQRVSGYLSSKAGSFFGFDEFTIEGNLFKFDKSWGPQLVASKRLSGRLDLTYSTTVGHLNDQTVRLGYKLTPRFSLQGETDPQGRAGLDLKYGFRFK